jgi:hypothetical protein
MYVVRTNWQGDTLWTQTYGGSNFDIAYSIQQTIDSGYVVAGVTNSPSGTVQGDFYVVKMGPDRVSDVGMSPPSLTRFELNPNYPNPFNPSTTISFSLSTESKVKLEVFDVTGRQVTTLINQTVQLGEHQAVFDGSGLPSGIYFARLISQHEQATQKLLLVK